MYYSVDDMIMIIRIIMIVYGCDDDEDDDLKTIIMITKSITMK